MATSSASSNRQSGRLQAAENERVLDEVTRRRRMRKQLEALEQDNFHDDPHANLQWHKKMPKFEDKSGKKRRNTEEDGEPASKKKRKIRGEHFKQRFRKNFHALLEEEYIQSSNPDNPEKPTYFSAQVPSSNLPVRHFCTVCGFHSNYTCVRCGVRYCSVKCRDVHTETRRERRHGLFLPPAVVAVAPPVESTAVVLLSSALMWIAAPRAIEHRPRPPRVSRCC
uniref:HIT-type domain-containing protein n=1 Tax=Plectus sambesii TaxID=2011161 RepID=A0A914XLV9_9BILA